MPQEETGNSRRFVPHLFEVLIALQFVVFQTWASTSAVAPSGRQVISSVLSASRIELLVLAAGLIVHAVWAAVRGTLHQSFAIWRSFEWLGDSVRLILFGAMLSYEYTWMKLLIPILHPDNFDELFWKLDRMLLSGHSPNIFFINLVGNSPAIGFFDRWYGSLFIGMLLGAIGFFFASPDKKKRIEFANGMTVLWLLGVWIYVATPALGPCYRQVDVFAEWWAKMPRSRVTQRMLLENYGLVLKVARGEDHLISPAMGIAAFPSLHVGHVTLIALLIRRHYRPMQLAGWLIVAFMAFGSVVTGWHYLIDGLAGAALAVIAFVVAGRMERSSDSPSEETDQPTSAEIRNA